MRELVVATRNAGKLREIRYLLEGERITVLGLDAFPDLPEVDEDGETFAVNAAGSPSSASMPSRTSLKSMRMARPSPLMRPKRPKP